MKFADKSLSYIILALLAIGLLALSSAAGGGFLLKQAIYIAISLSLIAAAYYFFSLEFYQGYSNILYWFNVALLVFLKFFGTTSLGSQRWLSLGFINIQPSEIAKICLIIFLASALAKRPINGYLDIFKIFLYISLPSLLVLIQPDLGTTLVYIAITFGMLFWAGATLIQILVITSPMVIAISSAVGKVVFTYSNSFLGFQITIPAIIAMTAIVIIFTLYYKTWSSPSLTAVTIGLAAFNFLVIVARPILWSFLKDYQQKRLTIFLDPYSDPLGSGYHIIQSLYAIGSGGVLGQGWKSGDLSQGNFVPEQHTDFIFSLVGEEFGFIGTTLVIVLYASLSILIVKRARESKNRFNSLIAIGIFSMMLFHIFVNIGMNLSLMPITGVPLPFLSYGGTSLLVNLFLMSLIAKIQFENQKY